MLYEMITGRKSFAGSSQASLIAAVMTTAPPPVSTLQPMASPALDRLVRTCLAKSPDERWQNAGDLSRELEWIAESGSDAGVPAPLAAKRRSRERMWQLAAGVAAVLLFALAGWVAVHLRNEAAPTGDGAVPDTLAGQTEDLRPTTVSGSFAGRPTHRLHRVRRQHRSSSLFVP
jgi:serine/threonine protein kinase